MNGVEIAGAVALAWVVVAALGWVSLLPLLRAANWADGPAELTATDLGGRREDPLDRAPARFGVVTGQPAGLPSLRRSGYLGLVLERLAVHGRCVLDADELCVLVRDRGEGEQTLVAAAAAGLELDLIGRRLAIDRGPLAAALACGRPTVVLDQPWPGWPARPDRPGPARRAALAPVWFGGGVQGALLVAHRGRGRAFAVSQLALLGELAQLVGQALGQQAQRALSACDPQAEVEGLLQTLARAEPDTDSHSAHVAQLTRALADQLELSACERLELELASRLHDVGKLRLPPHLLARRGPLDQTEWELMHLHPLWGAEMIAAIPGLEAVALLARFHHERWDGHGYPDGLAGDQIPLASRIIAICDAYSAMTSDRPYRPALHPTAALRQLHTFAGSQFDPQLTALFAHSPTGAKVFHSA